MSIALALLLAPAPVPPIQEQAPADGWKLPPPEVVEIVDAPPTPSVRLSPDKRWMLLVERPSLPTIADVAREWLPLAGSRIDPVLNARYQVSFDTGLLLRPLEGGEERRVELPDGARVDSVSWSHTSDRFAFTLAREDGLELWVCDAESAKARPLAQGVNGVLGRGFTWMPDGARLACLLLPEDRAPAPERSRVPQGPTVLETSGKTSPVRTYQDLLQDEHDGILLEHYGRSQVAIVGEKDGAPHVRRLGAPDLYTEADPSPDGEHLLVTRMHRPFSYLLPHHRFPRAIEVWSSASGKKEHLLADLPLADEIPIEGVPTGPRSVSWRPLQPATLVWVEALDGGDPKVEVEHRDRWLELPAPFAGAAPRELLRTQHRARGLTWMEDPGKVLASDYDRDRRWTRTMLHDLSKPDAQPVVLEDRSVRDRYGDPGGPLMEPTAAGSWVVRQDGPENAWIHRSGRGASPEGDRPFLDRQDLRTLETKRLWQCEPGVYESFDALLDVGAEGGTRILTNRESVDEPPNLHLRDLAAGTAVALTDFPDPTPQLRGIHKELVTYQRADGVPLSATLYLPKGYEPGTRLPLFVWAYPLEYNDPATAGQISGSPHRFTRIGGSSHLFLLTQGYAVLDGATMPIVGDPETMNDTFVEQVVAAAQAAIDVAAERGVADPARVGVGGHSYGAFMTANLLAHCDLFRAGIARSGAYNRTLTPFGFQSERRTLWEAPQVYAAVSPFFHAHAINEPLLMIHGEKDSNSGTFPMQSERLYHAVKGHGGTARLVLLPEEDHGYRARESVLHTLAEMIEWMDRHVKGAAPIEARAPRAPAPEQPASTGGR